jgi:hypothetical protein
VQRLLPAHRAKRSADDLDMTRAEVGSRRTKLLFRVWEGVDTHNVFHPENIDGPHSELTEVGTDIDRRIEMSSS